MHQISKAKLKHVQFLCFFNYSTLLTTKKKLKYLPFRSRSLEEITSHKMHVTKYNQKMRSSQTKICQFLEKMEEKKAKPRTAVADQQKLNETIVVSSCSRRWSGHLLNKIKARNKDNTPLCTSKQQNAQITKQNDTRSFSLFTCI